MNYDHVDLFTGIGGFSLGLERAGFKTVVFCEQDKFCQKVLKKHWPGVPIEPDIKNFDGKKYAGAFILTGGFPCQPFSCAGKRRGKEDDRALWPEMFRVIQEVRPRWIIGENVAGFIGMGLDESISDLEREGYSVQAFIIPACAVNAPHRRDRVWIVGNSSGERLGRGCENSSGIESGLCRKGFKQIKSDSHAADSHGNGLQEQGAEQQANRDRQLDETSTDTESPKCKTSEYSRSRGNRITANNKDVSDAQGVGLQGSFKTDGIKGQKSHDELLYGRRGEWSEPWLEVASEFCGIYDGLSDWIHRHYDRIISEEDYEITTQEDRAEGVQILRTAIQSEEIWGQVGRILQIPEKGILLTLLFYFQGESIKKGEQVESTEVGNNKGLRNLWNNSGFKCSSQRFELHEQRGKELTSIMPELSFKTARIFAKITDYIICGESTMSNKDRVNRLKALGNAVVPQIPEIIGRAIMEIENENCN